VTPRVSVVIPFFNGERFLGQAVESVRAQTLSDWELLLIDDGSRDGGTDLAQSLASEDPARIRYFRHEMHANRGVSASRNLGNLHARGEFIALLDADDIWYPTKLSEQVALLDACPSADIVFGCCEYWRSWSGGKDTVPHPRLSSDRCFEPPTLLIALLEGELIPPPSDLMFRKNMLGRTGGFVEDFTGMFEDGVFLAKCFSATTAYVSSRTWTRYRIHPSSMSAKAEQHGIHYDARLNFLRWMSDSLRERAREDAQLRCALHRALLPLRHPRLHRLAWRVRRALTT